MSRSWATVTPTEMAASDRLLVHEYTQTCSAVLPLAETWCSAAIRAEPRQFHVIPLARDAKRRLAFVVYAVYFGAVVEAQPHHIDPAD